ncbi:MAG TPA: pyridoxal-dependent decarboxylase [Acidobacteriaceae bacterium]
MTERGEKHTQASVPARRDVPDDGTELTLDPADWSTLRTQAHQMLDDMLLHLATLREQPAWQPMPAAVQQALGATDTAMPIAGEPLADVYSQFVTNILPYTSGNRHPRAWGWVRGTGTPVAMLAEMLAAGINAHVGGGNSAPVLVEQQVITWLARALEMPEGTSGLLTSGGTMANLLGLAVARHAGAGFDVREEGLSGAPRMTFYCSNETHFWARKAVELLGLGRASLREVAVDREYRVDLEALQLQIDEDRRAGMQPIAVIGNAGTVNTGAMDDLIALRRLADRERMWLHVDGAIGALLKLAPGSAGLVGGLESADSVACDLRKWRYLPCEAGCLLVRDSGLDRAACATAASYMEPEARGMLSGDLSFADLGIESSRSFKALKVWMALKTHGLRTLGALIEQNVSQAAYLAALVAGDPELEMLAPLASNVVCFAYKPPESGREREQAARVDRNALQRELVIRLQESGEWIVSGTVLKTASGDRYAIRVAITNHRSRREDYEALAQAVVATGRQVCADLVGQDERAAHA